MHNQLKLPWQRRNDVDHLPQPALQRIDRRGTLDLTIRSAIAAVLTRPEATVTTVDIEEDRDTISREVTVDSAATAAILDHGHPTLAVMTAVVTVAAIANGIATTAATDGTVMTGDTAVEEARRLITTTTIASGSKEM